MPLKTKSGDTLSADLYDRLRELKEAFDRATAKPIETRPADRVNYLVFELGREWFAWPVANLAQIEIDRRIVALPGRQADLYGVMNYKNKVLAVANLHHRLNLNSIDPDEIKIVLISKGLGVEAAIAVDRLVAIAPLSTSAMAPRPISLESETAQLIAGEFHHRGQMVTVLNPAGFSG
ncbi:MAG: chemotaxis protein CheW [Desulfobacteraceae bacterium]|jgi:chemotaxis signal transduction protein